MNGGPSHYQLLRLCPHHVGNAYHSPASDGFTSVRGVPRDMSTLAGPPAPEPRVHVVDRASGGSGRITGHATRRMRALLEGPLVRGEVVHAGRDAVYALVEGRCYGVLSRNAVHVPCGIRTTLPALSGVHSLGGARPGDPAYVGERAVHVGGLAVGVSGLVDAAPSALPRPDLAGAALHEALWPRTEAVRAELPARALTGLASGDPIVVGDLLGRGSGLTPVGDDVLSGWLATARLVGHPGFAAVGEEVARSAARRTTALSATLLDCAIGGEAIPPFHRLLTRLGRLSEAGPNHLPEDDPALTALLRVGHTSGTGLALGCLLALDGAASPTTEGSHP